ncbi:MAG TPA: hypothetical protein VIL47_00010 [Candidatus Bipolaricaulota bacterium]
MTGKCMGALAALVLLIAPWVWAASSEDVANLIQSMPLSASAKATVNAGFLRGIADGRLTADQALAFLQRIATSGASIEDRQTVLVSIGQTLLEDIPVEMLINKVDEGLARGLPMDVIAAEVVERRQTLVEVKALLNLTGIQIQQQTNEPGFPRSAVDAAVTDIATVLENHVRSGKQANDGTLLDTALATLDRDGRVAQQLFEALAAALTEADLTAIAGNIAGRL